MHTQESIFSGCLASALYPAGARFSRLEQGIQMCIVLPEHIMYLYTSFLVATHTLTPARTPRLGLCHNTLTPVRTPRLGLCHNTLTPVRTPRLGLCHNTDTSTNSKARAVPQHTDTSKNTKARAVLQHRNQHEQQGLGCGTTH